MKIMFHDKKRKKTKKRVHLKLNFIVTTLPFPPSHHHYHLKMIINNNFQKVYISTMNISESIRILWIHRESLRTFFSPSKVTKRFLSNMNSHPWNSSCLEWYYIIISSSSFLSSFWSSYWMRLLFSVSILYPMYSDEFMQLPWKWINILLIYSVFWLIFIGIFISHLYHEFILHFSPSLSS